MTRSLPTGDTDNPPQQRSLGPKMCCRGRLCVVIAAMMSLLLASRASAQFFRMGLSEALPRPISSLDLAQWATAITLSEAQRRGLEALHDQYKLDFDALADTTLAEFASSRATMQGMPFANQPSLNQMTSWLAKEKAAMDGIAALDEQLFAGLTELVTDEQQALLERVRLTRERQRLVSNELVREWLVPNTQTDLWDVYETIAAELPAESRAAAESVLTPYQTSYVVLLRSLHNGARDMYREWARRVSEQGLPQVNMSQAGFDREVWQKVVDIWSAVTAKVKPVANEMTELNHRTAKSVLALLPPEHSWDLWQVFLARAYRDLAERLESRNAQVQATDRMEELTDEQRRLIAAEYDSWLGDMKGLIDRNIAARDALYRGERPGQSRHEPADREREAEVTKTTSERGEKFEQALVGIVGKDRVRDLYRAASPRRPNMTPPRDFDSPFAPPIAAASLAALTADPDVATIMKAMHADYSDQYAQRLKDAQQAIMKLRIGFLPRGDDRNSVVGYASPPEIDKARQLEREALAALRQLDAAFFDDLTMALDAPRHVSVEHARHSREWNTHARGGRKGLTELRAYDAYVWLYGLLDELKLSAEETAIATEVVGERSDALLAAAKVHFEANRAAWFVRDLAMSHSHGIERGSTDVQRQAAEDALAAEVTAEKRRQELAALNRQVLESLIAALPSRVEALRERWEREAFPRVFVNPQDAAPLLVKALALPDLDEQQQTELERETLAFNPAARALRERMIEVNLEWDRQLPETAEGKAARDAAKYRWDQLLFQRDEVNAKARAALGRILRPEQQSVLGLQTGM